MKELALLQNILVQLQLSTLWLQLPATGFGQICNAVMFRTFMGRSELFRFTASRIHHQRKFIKCTVVLFCKPTFTSYYHQLTTILDEAGNTIIVNDSHSDHDGSTFVQSRSHQQFKILFIEVFTLIRTIE